ncbi:hypothetical protein LPB142_07700 [Rhodobacter xanthinilyticus]|uniref:ABC transmembrane type-2 domain-containing protein n=1 Tax=Rhodobacter xanthinilyticus TaxID=1850250 RepID=A0A1D9MBJ9_9RHOB|nr:ABC transporter permease [Rhodobacter xanthinilyticus]AOZ69217.1 hypothetical protein LPB142_07700 [Rhodobacter xanthinilyticus]
MLQSLKNTARLTLKELRAIRADKVMLVLIFYVFTVATYMVADAISTEINDLAVAVVDEDQSPLSQHLTDAIRAPMFKTPDSLTPDQAEAALKVGGYVLVVSFPPEMERDLRAGRATTIKIDADTTAIAQAGNGATFLQQLLAAELSAWAAPSGANTTSLVSVVFRNLFNPNLTSKWFTSVMELMNSITILTLILAGASLIREREHGTIEHVLVMPVRPHEIVLSKIAANGAVILAASVFSLVVVVEWIIGVPIGGSLWLFVLGTAVYVVAVAALGLMLASFTHTMGQFGLLIIPVIIVMILLSGGMTPMESMPDWLQTLMKLISPAPHFVAFAQGVLYRGAGASVLAPEIGAMAAMAGVALTVVVARFRKVLS